MYDENIVLCISNAYEQKYFYNDDFETLPEAIQQELKALAVLFTEDVGGILIIGFTEDGNVYFKVEADEDDLLYDEIGSHLKIKELQRDRKELWEALETYFKVFFLGEDFDETFIED
jgi:hypothetical protein